jgi:glycosyltransferase involved in cell wall biosynthesis
MDANEPAGDVARVTEGRAQVSEVRSAPRWSPDLSIVVPVHNEALNLPILWDELREVLATRPWTVEVIFVDDGSTDASADVIRKLRSDDVQVRLVRFAANAGLSAAFDAGLKRARGRVVVTMDADLQNDPRDIPGLVALLGEWDAATGIRRDRRDPWLRRISSRVANAIRNAVTGEQIQDSACSLRAMKRECVAVLDLYDGLHRFLPTLLRVSGYRVVEAPVTHRPRRFGASHFGVRNRAWRAFVDLLAVRWLQRHRLRYEAYEDDP